MDDVAQAEVQGLTRLAMAFTPLKTEARARKAEAHKRRTKTWICETHEPPHAGHARPHTRGSGTAALGGIRGNHECPRIAQWQQTTPQYTY